MNKPMVAAARLAVVAAAVAAAVAASTMPVARQNALVQQYCAVCHTDAARNGGLTLEHFDAAQADPSLVAMMLSKVTGGVSLQSAKAASSDPNAAALVAMKMRSGAMGAAGIPIPDKTTIDALIEALASEATGATEWNLNRTEDPATKSPITAASILREAPSTGNAGEAGMYRLVLSCNAATREGGMQLTWAPIPKTGRLSVVVDGGMPLVYEVEGEEKMGNGSQVTAGPSAVGLSESGQNSGHGAMPLPKEVLAIQGLSPGEFVEFPFGELAETARQSLAGCFKK
jgi:mono/diheme cytochrome c family protein